MNVEALHQAPAFTQKLRWQLISPSGLTLFSSFFLTERLRRIVLPDQGTYKIRVYTDGVDADGIGEYSFRAYATVTASPDNASTQPDRPVFIATSKLLFNDRADNPSDTLRLTLPSSATSEGGTVSQQEGGVLYTPKSGSTGRDRFTYRLRGDFDGTNDTTVTVAVTALADDHATVVNWIWKDTGTVEVCLMAEPNIEYELQSSPDLKSWLPIGEVVVESESHQMSFLFEVPATQGKLFFRAPKK